ncbi:MAG: hypothetical protein J6R03_05670 [Treponema sp.]|nr:hypothetical protein [Treponema sp.]
MKKFRFVLLAALLLAFSFMGCKLPETTYTYEFGIVDTANADKVINRLPNYVNFDILEEAKEDLCYYTYEEAYEKFTALKKDDVVSILDGFKDPEFTELVLDKIEKNGNWLVIINYTDTDALKGWMYFEKE